MQQFGLSWTTFAVAAGLGATAVVGFFALRRVLGWLLGPIFVYETMRLARKGHTFWLRIAFALLVLALMYSAKPEVEVERLLRFGAYMSLEVDPAFAARSPAMALLQKEMARFANEFSHSFLLMLGIVVVLVTPLYFGSAISEEKEKRTLDFLLGTRVTSWDVVVGKLAARVLNLFGVLLTALPILAITQVWGGVDYWELLQGFVAIAVAMVTYSCICILLSAWAVRTRTAVILGYVTMFLMHWPGLGLTSPIILNHIMLPDLRTEIAKGEVPDVALQQAMAIFLAIHAGLSLFFLLFAVGGLRAFARRQAGRHRRVYEASAAKAMIPHPMAVAPNPPLRGDPLVWKERYIGRTVGAFLLGRLFWIIAFLLLAVLSLVAPAVIWMEASGALKPSDPFAAESKIHRGLADAVRAGAAALGAMLLVGVGLRLASSVSREREQRTLNDLLTLPIDRSTILRAKWQGTWVRARAPLAAAAVLLILAGVTNDIPVFAGILLPFALASHICLFGNIALFLSVVCRSTYLACLVFLVVLIVFCGGSWIVSYFANDIPTIVSGTIASTPPVLSRLDRGWLNDHYETEVDDLLNPPQAWWHLMRPAQHWYLEYPGLRPPLSKPWLNGPANALLLRVTAGQVVQAAIPAVIGCLIWFATTWVFHREGARS